MNDQMIEIMLFYAQSFIGVPYLWGGQTPIAGFDCSGYVQTVLESIGIDPPGDQTAQGLYNHLSKKNWRSGVSKGSILFFGYNTNHITHVEIALNAGLMIGASGGGRGTVNREIAARQNAFVKIRPILSRNDRVAAIMPASPEVTDKIKFLYLK